ncbi:MAG: class I SAM-dependent RNA methyltransferase [Acidimicrobiia bacterium]
MIELHPHAIAHGGEAVARRDGKAHFVAGAMPGEVVTATIEEDRGSWARVALVDIIEPAAGRREPPCPHATTCGGCQWQFATEQLQREWKRDTVISQLEHLGRIQDPVVHDVIAPGPEFGYRNRMDFQVIGGKPGLMRSRSNDIVPLDVCLILHDMLRPLFQNLGDLSGLTHATLRVGTRTGDVVAIVEGDPPPHLEEWNVPIALRSDGGLHDLIGEPSLSEIVDDTLFSIPLDGFFQNNTLGADALVTVVRGAAEIEDTDTILDGYCGVGLFGATVGKDAERVLAIEASPAAVNHARRNLTEAGIDHNVIGGSFTRDIELFEEYWNVAIVDPPRKGLSRKGVDAVTSAGPRRIVYVSCDPASLARDAHSFAEYGYSFVEATPIDLFPQTYHIETVATFVR